MLIYILLLCFILMLIGSYFLFKKEIMHPVIIFIAMYTFSVLCAVCNIDNWGIEMSKMTFIILLLGAVEFVLVSYITQKGAEAVYSKEGQEEIKENIKYYMENAKIIREGLEEVGITYYGGINSPYVWLKVPNNMKSWDFFDLLLEKANVVGTPGVGFGPSGEGYFRLTAFGERKNTEEAMKRIKETLQF